jgi:hypothetical protein
MAAKKRATRSRSAGRAAGPRDVRDTRDAVQRIVEALASHEAAIRQLAEVVVNLHENVRALREVAEALAEGATDERVVGASRRLRRVKLRE